MPDVIGAPDLLTAPIVAGLPRVDSNLDSEINRLDPHGIEFERPEHLVDACQRPTDETGRPQRCGASESIGRENVVEVVHEQNDCFAVPVDDPRPKRRIGVGNVFIGVSPDPFVPANARAPSCSQ